MKDVYNFIQVDSELGTSGVVGADAFTALRRAGYEVVINLLPDESEYATAGEAGIVEELGMEYVYIPVDFAAPTKENYADFAARLKAFRGKRVYAHCAANWRVSSFVALYGERELGWTRSAADALIEKAWGQPDAVWTAFLAEVRALPAL